MKIKLNKFQKIVGLIILLALIVRIIYVVRVPYYERQHDVEPNGNGLSYIFSLYDNWKLPEENWGQHYHPPLHQIIAALWLKVIHIFIQDFTPFCESLQFLTLIYSMGLIIVTYKILNELKLKEKYKLFIISIMAFHPTFIILSGSINNDMLCLLLSMWSILRLMKWYKKTDIRNTTILAIIIGLAVMTKTSGELVAIPTIYIFLLKLYKDMKKSKNKDAVGKRYFYLYIYFGCISLPIGLWYAVRNYILFNQPLVYIMDIHNADLYAGDVSIFRRLIPFSSEIFNMYCNMLGDKNIIIFLIKNSLFGEYTWQKGGVFNICYVVAICTNIIMMLITVYSIIRNMMRKEKRNFIWKIFFVILYLFNIVSYISMNNELPYTCSMDFRYMFPTLFIGVLFIAFELYSMKRENFKYEKIFYNIIMCISYILMISSDIIILFSEIV